MEITWLGHSAFLIKGDDNIVVDPFLTDNPKAAVTQDKLSCDIVCVTHGHSDHLGDTIAIAKRNNAKVLAMVELAGYLEKKGCEVIGFNIGGSVSVGSSRVTMTQAIHSSGLGAEGLEGGAGVSNGFVIDSGKTVYHAGDTALFGDMSLIGSMHRIDVALLPIGGFFTMDVIQAAKAVELLNPRIAVPMHYDTWPPIRADPELFRSEAGKLCGADVRILSPGETLKI